MVADLETRGASAWQEDGLPVVPGSGESSAGEPTGPGKILLRRRFGGEGREMLGNTHGKTLMDGENTEGACVALGPEQDFVATVADLTGSLEGDFEGKSSEAEDTRQERLLRRLRFEERGEDEIGAGTRYHADMDGNTWHGWVEYDADFGVQEQCGSEFDEQDGDDAEDSDQEQCGSELDVQDGDDLADDRVAGPSGTTGGSADSLRQQLEEAKDKLQMLQALASASSLGQVAARAPRHSRLQHEGCDAVMKAALDICAEVQQAQRGWRLKT